MAQSPVVLYEILYRSTGIISISRCVQDKLIEFAEVDDIIPLGVRGGTTDKVKYNAVPYYHTITF